MYARILGLNDFAATGVVGLSTDAQAFEKHCGRRYRNAGITDDTSGDSCLGCRECRQQRRGRGGAGLELGGGHGHGGVGHWGVR